jgi:hypothetical protein
MANKRVYFSFHYQDVADFRANVVRNHKIIGSDSKSAGYLDASIWEEAKKKGDLALKRMINSELDYTSMTVVLIGSETYDRRWVRYEIMKSLQRGNQVIGVHINSIKDKFGNIKPMGADPFDHLALSVSADGSRGSPMEHRNGKWSDYGDLEGWSFGSVQPPANHGKAFKLNHWLTNYDWVAHDGYTNFASWIGA